MPSCGGGLMGGWSPFGESTGIRRGSPVSPLGASTGFRFPARLLLLAAVAALPGCQPNSPNASAVPGVSRVAVFEDFALGELTDDWAPRTPQLWRIAHEGNRRLLQMAVPPERPMMPGVRRPQEYALYNKYEFRSFSLSCRVRADRDVSVSARDAVIIFGRRDDTHLYYVHLSGVSDEWHNALVRVDGDTRVSLVPPAERPPPTLADAAWHKVDVLRDVDKGTIAVYVDAYDETARPVFQVTDRTYEWGRIGLGSFDDHASFTHIQIEGQARKRE